MADTGTECESFFQNIINSMLVTTSWVDDLKSLLGMDAVSQIWGDRPAWYLWLSEARGAYHLQLIDAMSDENLPANRHGFFSIKCYPYQNSAVFDSFSFEEQALRQGGLFDHTHTPRFEEKEKIPDSLFNVAAMQCRVSPEDKTACFTLESLDSLRCVYPEETVQRFDLLNKSKHFAKGALGRSVPGWHLGFPVFDRLLSMYAFYSRTKPVRLRVERSPGFEYVHAGDQEFACVDAPHTHRLAVSVLFSPQECFDHGANLNGLDAMAPEDAPPQTKVLFDQVFPCGHIHASDRMACSKILDDTHINELWWSLADTNYKSHLGSTCGCH